jgi:type I restriction enzyme S subunit
VSQLPPSWTEAPIGSLCIDTEQVTPEDEAEFTYVDIGSVDRFTKRITSPQRLLGKNAPSRARKLIKAGDTIVSTTRPNLNAVALIEQALDGQIASTGFEVLRAPGLDPRWLSYMVRTNAFVDAMSSLVQGALYPAVRGKDVRSFLAPVAPSNEQKRIADKLDIVLTRVDAVNTRLARVAPLLKRFRQSVLAAATSGRLTEDWRAQSHAPTRSTIALGDLVISIDQGWSPKCEANAATQEQWAVIKTTAIQALHFYPEENKALPNDLDPRPHLALRDGDVLITRAGPRSRAGITCIVTGDQPRLMLCDKAYRVRVDRSKIHPQMLNLLLNSPEVLDAIDEMKTGISESGVNLTQAKFRELALSVPHKEEQAEIICRVDTLFAFADRLEARLQAAQTATDRLTPSLLAKAFRGELVPQDPNDEPASELLMRLVGQGPTSKTKHLVQKVKSK